MDKHLLGVGVPWAALPERHRLSGLEERTLVLAVPRPRFLPGWQDLVTLRGRLLGEDPRLRDDAHSRTFRVLLRPPVCEVCGFQGTACSGLLAGVPGGVLREPSLAGSHWVFSHGWGKDVPEDVSVGQLAEGRLAWQRPAICGGQPCPRARWAMPEPGSGKCTECSVCRWASEC